MAAHREKRAPRPKPNPLVSQVAAFEFLKAERGASVANFLVNWALNHRGIRVAVALDEGARDVLLGADDEPTKDANLNGLCLLIGRVIHRLRILEVGEVKELAVPRGPRPPPSRMPRYEHYHQWSSALEGLQAAVRIHRDEIIQRPPLGGGLEVLDAKDERAFAVSLDLACQQRKAKAPTGLEMAALAVACGAQEPVRCGACRHDWKQRLEPGIALPTAELICPHINFVTAETKLRGDRWRKHLERREKNQRTKGLG